VVELEEGRATARTVDEAPRTCHFCFFCKDICPHNAVSILSEEDDVLGRI
jgi:NAD-dependent dihydropyrimidine dehydrogenase PreA subunit